MSVQTIYQFYSELFEYEPLIWRRFQVMGNITLSRFCYILMTMYEMQASHLFSLEFPLGSKDGEKVWRYEIPAEYGCFEYDDEDNELPNITTIKLSEVIDKAGRGFVFKYDFGDNWVVPIELEKTFVDEKARTTKYPRILEGEGFGIIEDIGGVYRLMDLADAINLKKGEDYDDFSEWLDVDNLNLTTFDKKDMNFRLKKIPKIYERIYEWGNEPSEDDIYLIEREYMENGEKNG